MQIIWGFEAKAKKCQPHRNVVVNHFTKKISLLKQEILVKFDKLIKDTDKRTSKTKLSAKLNHSNLVQQLFE